MHKPGIPADLQEIIDTHRALFGGFRMMADVQDGTGVAAGEAPAADQAASQSRSTSTGSEPQSAVWDGKVESLPQGAQDLIKNLRTENASKRTAAKSAEDEANRKIADALKALGINTEGEIDPVKAAQEAAAQTVAERDAERRARVLSDAELVVWRNAAELKVNAAALTDSRAFERAIANLDPTADDFADKVKAAATEAAKNNTTLQAAQAAGRSGTEMAGGTGEGAKKPASLEEAIALKMGAA